MRITTMVALLCVLLAGTAFAGDNGNGCKLQGTWIGEMPYPLPDDTPFDPTDDIYYMLKFFVTYHGTGDNKGTDITEFINPVPVPGTAWSNARGIWEKIGPNRYKYMLLVYVYDVANGDIIQINRQVGIKTLTDCNTNEATATIEYLNPDMTPMDPAVCVPIAVTVHRMIQEEPCDCE